LPALNECDLVNASYGLRGRCNPQLWEPNYYTLSKFQDQRNCSRLSKSCYFCCYLFCLYLFPFVFICAYFVIFLFILAFIILSCDVNKLLLIINTLNFLYPFACSFLRKFYNKFCNILNINLSLSLLYADTRCIVHTHPFYENKCGSLNFWYVHTFVNILFQLKNV